jgi:putative Mg2+ transporter-C (MgtC) family protein
MIPDQEIILRIVIAAILGAVIGLERERQAQPAGLRTHIILVVGATLTMALSINLAIQFRPLVPNGDPARLAAQVVSGIGFLGAGAILRYGPNIKGLTTATSLWTMAIVGLAIGAGHYASGIAATAISLIALIILNVIEKRFIQSFTTVIVEVRGIDRDGLTAEVLQALKSVAKSVDEPGIEKDLIQHTITIKYTIKIKSSNSMENIANALCCIEGVQYLKTA